MKMSEDGKLHEVVSHKNLKDNDQTVRVKKPVRTGDNNDVAPLMMLLVSSAGLMLAIKKRKELN